MNYLKNPYITSNALPVDVVFHPSWWHRNAGIVFDEDFFYHPLKRVEDEMLMEEVLYEKFGRYGLGGNRGKELPVIGAVHNSSGYILSEMLGCDVRYSEKDAPQVVPAGMEKLQIDKTDPFDSTVFKRMLDLMNNLKDRYGYVTGDINWGGVLNIALDLAGEKVLTDFFTEPAQTGKQFRAIAGVIERFVSVISAETGTSSISVNRNVRHIKEPVFLHSECSHTMISTDQYDEYLLPLDLEWSRKHRPFGIHYCGNDPHRYAGSFSRIKNLDFLDVGWGGDLKILRDQLPVTFLNIRLDPVTINSYSDEQLDETITRLVEDSGNPFLTGICCINMDDKVEDSRIHTIFRTVERLRAGFDKSLN